MTGHAAKVGAFNLYDLFDRLLIPKVIPPVPNSLSTRRDLATPLAVRGEIRKTPGCGRCVSFNFQPPTRQTS